MCAFGVFRGAVYLLAPTPPRDRLLECCVASPTQTETAVNYSTYLSRIEPYEDDQTAIFIVTEDAQINFPVSNIFFAFVSTSNCMITP
jgi:hypothetical protein